MMLQMIPFNIDFIGETKGSEYLPIRTTFGTFSVDWAIVRYKEAVMAHPS
jgi:hypothetical protein